MGLYRVDLTQHGIVAGHLEKDANGHYTTAQYQQARNNGIGIQNAIYHARDNGYSGILLPKNTYSLCYHRTVQDDTLVRAIIFPVSNQEINLNGSILEVIYDSTQKSPYDTINTYPWQLGGRVFMTLKVNNVIIRNGELRGDIYNRSFTETEATGWDRELAQENTMGIGVYSQSHNILIENMNIHGFMADSISMSTRPFKIGYGYMLDVVGSMKKGYIKDNGEIVQKDGAYYSENIITINRQAMAAAEPLAPNTIQIQTGGGYTRIPKFVDHHIQLAFYDSNGNFLNIENVKYLNKIALPKNVEGVRFQLVNQGVDTATIQHPSITLTTIASSHVTIRRCKLHDNHRGGIANCSDNTVIENCEIYNNGLDSSIGAPIYPDTTRYQINCEDAVSRDVVIRNNHIYNGFHGILLGCYNAIVEGNILNNVNGIGLYNIYSCVIRNNKFFDSGEIGLYGGVNEDFNLIFDSNIIEFESGAFALRGSKKGIAMFTNNIIEARGLILNEYNSGNLVVHFNNNNFKSTIDLTGATTAVLQNPLYADYFNNNVFEIEGSPEIYLYLSYKIGGGNVFRNLRFRSKSQEHLQFTNDIFENCTSFFQFNYPKKNYSVYYKNCTIKDSKLNPFASYSQDLREVESIISFENCDIQLLEKQLVSMTSYDKQPVNYLVRLKNCSLSYSSETKPKLIDFLGQTSGRLDVEVTNVEVINNDNFENLIR